MQIIFIIFSMLITTTNRNEILDLLQSSFKNSFNHISDNIYSSPLSTPEIQPYPISKSSLVSCLSIPSQSTLNSLPPSSREIIEISSDSDFDESSPSFSMTDTTNSLIQQYSYNFSCSSHSSNSISAPNSSAAWSMAKISQWLNQYLPIDFPQPGRFGYSGRISSVQWSSLLSGISCQSLLPPTLEMPTQDMNLASITTYDIDSFIAKVKCLSIATKGLRVQFAPSCLKNISSDVHLFSKIEETLPTGKVHIYQVPLHQIPHFYLGHLASSLHLPLYVFLPGLWSRNASKNSYISNQHLQQWMDIEFIPAIVQHCPADVVQHFPLSFSSASMNIFARGRELGIQENRFESGKRQELHYFLSGKYLKNIWQDMIKFSQRAGYTHFQEMFLLIDAKDLKLQLKSSSISGSWELMTTMLEGDLDFNCLEENFQFLDLGQEVSSLERSTTCFFRKCCLENRLMKIKERSPGLQATTYSWALTTATANQTLAYSKSSSQYENGLIYSQFYSPLKSIFDAGSTYPLQNSSLDYLSLSSEILKIWQSSGAAGERVQIDIEKLEKAYCHSRDRVLLALKEAIQQRRSFGIRQEHRLSFQSFKTLRDRAEEIDFIQLPTCCYMQNSEEIYHFLTTNFLRFGLGLEYTATKLKACSFEQSHDLSRTFRMFLLLQKASFTNTLLQA